MTPLAALLEKLGDEIQDVDEGAINRLTRHATLHESLPSQDLGMVDPKQEQLELSIAGKDFEITQSPGLLQSKRGGGTTGAAVWQVTVRFAEWLSSQDNPLFATGALDSDSTVLELGAGISGIVPVILSSKVGKFVATDQAYVLKALRDNINANSSRKNSSKTKRAKQDSITDVLALDWENDDAAGFLRANDLSAGVDMIVACDCVYNYALVPPLTQTCADLCQVRSKQESSGLNATICVVVQQLRQPEVFEEWLTAFRKMFRVWRFPDELLTMGLRQSSGFVVHLGALRM